MRECIYFDSAAAMSARSEILDSFKEYTLRYPANPEALHSAGVEAAMAIKRAGEDITTALIGSFGDDYALTWSSSATEAISMAFMFPYFKGKVILTTDSEHPAMQYAVERSVFCEASTSSGVVRKVSVNSDGLVDLEMFEAKLDSDVAVVAVHHVQNETGALQDLCELRRIINRKAPDAIFIVDTVQSIAKLAIPWQEAKINIAFIGGHKVGAPSGGALISNFYGNSKLRTAFRNHLSNLRSPEHYIGRPDTAICMALADAVVYAESTPLGKTELLGKVAHLNKVLRAKFADLAEKMNLKILMPVPADSATPYIVTVLIPTFQSEILVRMLADKGVMVSAGSACEASNSKPSQALIAIAGSEKSARSVLRVSFSCKSQINEVEQFISKLTQVLIEY